MTSRCTS